MKTEIFYLHKDRKDVTLTAYILDDSKELRNGIPRGAVLICPGGAYLNCSDREAEPVALRFAAMGYHAFVLRYSTYLEGEEGNFWDFMESMEPKKDLTYPLQIREVGQAMLILREHAEEWRLDPEKIALCGFSAGAHNAAMYGVSWNQPVICEYFQKEAELFRPAALILGYPVSDYVYMKECAEKNEIYAGLFQNMRTALLGEATDENALKEVSPNRKMTAEMPPVFLWATAGDHLVPVQHSIRMANALADHQIPFEMHIFEEGDHGLVLGDETTAGALSEINDQAAKWTELCRTWLAKRLAPELPKQTAVEVLMQNRSAEQRMEIKR